MADLTPLPARITLQVREGVPNSLHEFTLRSRDTRPTANPETGARLDHDVLLNDIIEALGEAMRKVINRSRQADPDNHEFEEWIAGLAKWVVKK